MIINNVKLYFFFFPCEVLTGVGVTKGAYRVCAILFT